MKKNSAATSPSPDRKFRGATGFALAAAAAYAFCLGWFSLCQYWGFKTQLTDLGNMTQAVWRASLGDWAMLTSDNMQTGLVSRLQIHSNFIFWFLTPIFKIWPYPETLLLINTTSCALTGLGLFFIAKHHLENSAWALWVAFSFWVSPLVQDAALFDFHAVTLAALFFTWAVWAFDTEKKPLGWLFLFLAALCKENVAPLIALYGLFLRLSGRKKLGGEVMLFAVLYAFIFFIVLTRYFTHGNLLTGPDDRYGWLGYYLTGDKPAGELLNLLTRPHKLRYLGYFLISGGLAGFPAFTFLMICLPELLWSVLEQGSWMTRITGVYYWIIPVAIVHISCILAANKGMPGPESGSKIKKIWPLAYLGTASMVLSLFFSPLPYSWVGSWDHFRVVPDRAILKDLDSKIDPRSGLCVQNNIGSYFSKRTHVGAFPALCRWPYEYVLFYLRDTRGPDKGFSAKTLNFTAYQFGSPEDLLKHAEYYLRSPNWGLLDSQKGFYLFKKNVPDKVPAAMKEKLFEADQKIFRLQSQESSRARNLLSGYLNGVVEWWQMPHFWKLLKTAGQPSSKP